MKLADKLRKLTSDSKTLIPLLLYQANLGRMLVAARGGKNSCNCQIQLQGYDKLNNEEIEVLCFRFRSEGIKTIKLQYRFF